MAAESTPTASIGAVTGARAGQPAASGHWGQAWRRLRRDRAALAGGVVFDSYGRDVAAWLRRIGFVLSTSDDESFHLSPAEGMASGAVPVLLGWPGADTIYDTRWIQRDATAIAESIAATVREGRWESERAFAREQVRAAYGLDKVCRQWTDLLAGALEPTQTMRVA